MSITAIFFCSYRQIRNNIQKTCRLTLITHRVCIGQWIQFSLKLFYHECLTSLSNPESRVFYRESCCLRDLESSGELDENVVGRRSSDGDEKRRRNLKRWKIAAPAWRIRELALAGRTSLASRRNIFVAPHRRDVSSFASILENTPQTFRYLYRSPYWCLNVISFAEDDPRKARVRKIAVSFITKFLERR